MAVPMAEWAVASPRKMLSGAYDVRNISEQRKHGDVRTSNGGSGGGSRSLDDPAGCMPTFKWEDDAG